MKHRPTVLVVLVRELSRASRLDGSVLWTANLLESLAELRDMNFVVVSCGPGSTRAANEEFAKALGIDHVFVPFVEEQPIRSGRARDLINSLARELWGVLSSKYFFLNEHYYRAQKHVDDSIIRVIEEKKPDLVVLNEVYSALCAPSVFTQSAPVCLISVNNEVAFHKRVMSELRAPVGKVHQRILLWLLRHGNWVANTRLRTYMGKLGRRCAGIVTLTADDLPSDLPQHVARAVIPPVLKSDRQWRYSASRSVFFVGQIIAGSNRLAIEWLCGEFARQLARIDEGVKIIIIGASERQVPREWLGPNVILLGYADKEAVRHQMTTADLFIAPIANNFGAKLKIAESISHERPFMATSEAMSGLPPWWVSMPKFDLAQPAEAAKLAMDNINCPEKLNDLSRLIATNVKRAREEQVTAWDSFLRGAIGRGKKSRESECPQLGKSHAGLS